MQFLSLMSQSVALYMLSDISGKLKYNIRLRSLYSLYVWLHQKVIKYWLTWPSPWNKNVKRFKRLHTSIFFSVKKGTYGLLTLYFDAYMDVYLV